MEYPYFPMKCARCGGLKYVGEEYYAMERFWVDVSCFQCSHSVDIECDKLIKFLKILKTAVIHVDKQNNS
jgi:hypothetical protein